MFPFPFTIARDVMILGLEMQAVIGLRLFQFASYDPRAQAEAQLMVTEKVLTLAAAQSQYAVDLLKGQGHKAPSRALALYSRKVRANRKRLMKN